MSLHFVNAYTSRNLGDAAIYESLVQLSGRTGASSDLAPAERATVRGLSAAEGHRPDAWVSVGGDIFNNARPWAVTRRYLELLRSLAACPPARTFVFGQGIPSSCRGAALMALSLVFRRLSSVTVRDVNSWQRLRDRGVDADLSYDTAFAYQPASGSLSAGKALFEHAGLDPERAVLASVRGFDQMYAHDGDRFESRLASLLSALRDRGHQPAIVVQSNADGADSDHAVVKRLRAQLPGLGVLDPLAPSFLAQGHHPLDALVGALGQAHAVIAVRYHTAVLRLLSGRAPWSLHYSTKGADLSQRLRLPGMAIESFDPDQAVAQIEQSAQLWTPTQAIAAEVRERFQQALSAARVGEVLAARSGASDMSFDAPLTERQPVRE
jgi:polysaccharide pyruvyl transferase WcaK-like protein